MQGLALKDALPLTEQHDNDGRAIPFSIRFVACDRERRTGGNFRELKNCKRVGYKHSQKKNALINIQDMDRPRSHPIPVHIDLIRRINGITIL